MSTVRCPTCNAPREIHNPGLVMFVCEHCRNAVYWDADAVRSAGEQAILSEGFTRLYRGAAGAFSGRRFLVAGRARYAFAAGFWDEWFLELEDGDIAWLTEDNHELAVQHPVAPARLATLGPPDRLRPGARFAFEGTTFAVQEVGEARCIGLEGALPRHVEVGERYAYVDASSLDGRQALGLELDADPPSAFLGRWLAWDDLALDDEGDGR